ncbi:hypothetical protein [Sphingobacterium sp.]|uniref:hypothetical protein n=1 Tax=Sphingobacterium sp. TaxID=341027 RepID=UPI0031CEACB9
MKKINYYKLLILLFLSCKEEEKMPHWPLNTNELVLPAKGITFDWNPKEQCRAILYSFSQPMELPTSMINGQLLIDLKNIIGVTEGPAELVLLGQDAYHFPLRLKNKGPEQLLTKTFYSPRTFDPDSSLIQQRLYVKVDQHRNLHPFSSTEYFKEMNYLLPTQAGTYCPEQNNPMSCYYINPGACAAIPFRIRRESDSLIQVEAGPLVDRYNNVIANGTLAQFILNEGKNISIGEVLVQKGYAKIKYPNGHHSSKKVVIKIGDRSSKITELSPTL